MAHPRRVDTKRIKALKSLPLLRAASQSGPGYPVGPGGGNHPRRRFHQPVLRPGKDLAVKEGDLVNAGQTIGQVDSIPTEISLPTHIHFELIGSDGNLDPLAIIGR